MSQDAPPTQVEDVVVEGRRLRVVVDQFVDAIAAPPVGRGPARWHTKVCVGVVNFQREAALALADQVSFVALRMGLEIGEPGCSPNVLVFATDDGREMARALVAREPRAFRPQYAGAARSAGSLERFQQGSAPVRWWHVSMPMDRVHGTPAVRLPGRSAPRLRGEGLLRTPVRNDLMRTFIVVDARAAEGIDLRGLGDYLGMVALAQIDPEADTSSYDTVLNLFDTARPQAALTDWDLAYLDALYGAELNQRAVSQQNGEISSSMFRDRRAAQQEGQ